MNINADGVRRVFDLIAATVGLLLLSPLLLILAIAIKRSSPGPIFYRAQRIGRGGRPFVLYKFRSMVADADKRGPAITAAGDSRITPIGRLLRRTKLDELPQLINVVKGEMSLVGPRPEDPRYVALYTPEQRRILDYRPGITSQASLVYRHEERLLAGEDWEAIYRNEIMPAKLRVDLDYLDHRNLVSDLALILRTVVAIVD
ncbi:MAG: sugar transferase [Anaerolineales bacterium]|nr:sugar transferase [Anaerolineales bacterium]